MASHVGAPSQPSKDSLRPLEIATSTYYWKPMQALFRAIELRLYCVAGIAIQDPLLDLGCGDGQVVKMLFELGRIRKPIYGIDVSASELRKAGATSIHTGLVCADANHLPFKPRSFSSVLANGVLCSVPGGVEASVSEASRVLKEGGTFVLTVPTDKFVNVLLLPKLLASGSRTLCTWYVTRINRRLPHFSTYAPEEWAKRLESHGFRIIKSENFFSARAGYLWSLLAMQLFRMFGLLKLIRSRHIAKHVSNALQRAFLSIYSSDHREKSDFGYLFIVAQK